MQEQLSGTQLFLRYAWPCAENKLIAKKITLCNFEILQNFIKRNVRPGVSFMRICFPTAVKHLEKFAKENNLETWAIDTVREFWRNHHIGDGNCAVKLGHVKFIYSNNSPLAISTIKTCGVSFDNGEQVVCIDTYNLAKTGDSVFVHQRTIIEKMED